MKHVVVTDVPRPPLEQLDELAEFGVATVHEAMGRTGLVGTLVHPLQQGARIAGAAVTALCWPGDNLMIHAAVEQCRPGDVLVVTTASPSLDGSFGELLGTALLQRGVRALVTTGGVRDVTDLRALGFPIWAAAQNAQGTVKATAGSVNVAIPVGGVLVRPGDAIVADDDGVLCVPRAEIEAALAASRKRVAKEAESREAYQRGELSLDRNNLRPLLQNLGVEYVSFEDHER
jgi:4-hydroxy-4-methyl-2-oxoglutarate aldolase